MKASTRELLHVVKNAACSHDEALRGLACSHRETLEGLRSVLYAMEAEARASMWEADWPRLREAIRELNERLEKENNSYEGGVV